MITFKKYQPVIITFDEYHQIEPIIMLFDDTKIRQKIKKAVKNWLSENANNWLMEEILDDTVDKYGFFIYLTTEEDKVKFILKWL